MTLFMDSSSSWRIGSLRGPQYPIQSQIHILPFKQLLTHSSYVLLHFRRRRHIQDKTSQFTLQ